MPAPVPAPEPGQPPAPAVEPPPPPPPPPPVLDPVSGHLYDPRGPRPTCARNVWSINGSIGDSWGFVLRNCTSFVSWRLHERNGMAGFDNHFRGEHWGNAANWDDVARRLGYRVDSVPAIGAVAQTDAGRVGHVAWVSDIGPGTVTIEEYNYGSAGGYGTRTVPVGDFRYLHLADVAPSPLVGSDRPVVSVPDGLGGSWTARVDDRGTLLLTAPGRPTRVVGRRGRLHPGGGTRVEPRRPRPPLGGRHLARRPGHGRYDAPRAAGPARRRHLGPDREPGARPVAHPATGARDGLRGGHAGHPAPHPRGTVDPARTGSAGRRPGRPTAHPCSATTPPVARGWWPSGRAERPTRSPSSAGACCDSADRPRRSPRRPPSPPPPTARPGCTRSARPGGSAYARSTVVDGAVRRRWPASGRRTPHPLSGRSPAACTWPPPTAPAPSSSPAPCPGGRPDASERVATSPAPPGW